MGVGVQQGWHFKLYAGSFFCFLKPHHQGKHRRWLLLTLPPRRHHDTVLNMTLVLTNDEACVGGAALQLWPVAFVPAGPPP